MPYLSKLDQLKLAAIDHCTSGDVVYYRKNGEEVSYATVVKWIVNGEIKKREMQEMLTPEELADIAKAPSRAKYRGEEN